MFDLIVVGGGAAGFFAALAAKAASPNARVALLEKSAVLLSKVRISGGGRCNVTHACFDPILLSKNYPRGEKELIAPFYRFQPRETIEWFESRGVSLKTEKDGRIFPITDSSATIIDCLLAEAKKTGVEIYLRQRIENIKKEHHFELQMKEGSPMVSKQLILASGSSNEGHAWAKSFGHTIHSPVPSLFTFNIENFALRELSGISFENAKIHICGTSLMQTGPLLITHFGFSGPAVLKLSAWAARYLNEKEYSVDVAVDWLPTLSLTEIIERLREMKRRAPNKSLFSENPFKLTKSFWKLFLKDFHSTRLNDIPDKALQQLAEKLHSDSYQMKGKTTHKEEFVTCGGVSLKEVDFKTMQSKITPNLYFAGEILDIDGVTGGFNFQNAWTTGFIAGSAKSNN